ncbi:hypothetical protein GUITHDRAFT_114974 [Guillardia theta CCMP2712]|uniref:Uncharacterized protein n=1 Tax=Guillardia theta (strain CCMP2712) TaxID=905079 RepID=L1IRK9_GUITC|nr:hypothetical protein GUITHDRAFT_114974 [Guillardia theta CCMP2712]EKX38868.1 hypothetical protein GUITHDRAFT_114974 [Guillardia theta CCMP2712]|eukprot:XP_005825848.1 hypothetical protein GUITHDRAFT_114974 [Guillardia theta CCMP2712]
MPKKSKKSKDKSSADAAPEEEEDFPEVDFKAEKWLNLQIRFVVWSFLDIQVKISTQTRLYTIVDKIKARHGGSIQDIILYKDSVSPSNVLMDLGMSLGDPLPDPKLEPDHESWDVIWYDYKPPNFDCPLLLSSPRGASRQDIARKVARDMETEARLKHAGGKKEEKEVRRSSVVQVNANAEESAESQEED